MNVKSTPAAGSNPSAPASDARAEHREERQQQRLRSRAG